MRKSKGIPAGNKKELLAKVDETVEEQAEKPKPPEEQDESRIDTPITPPPLARSGGGAFCRDWFESAMGDMWVSGRSSRSVKLRAVPRRCERPPGKRTPHGPKPKS